MSARLPKLRIIAVERLRGPDHMAMRTVTVTGRCLRPRTSRLDPRLVEPLQPLDHRPAAVGQLPPVDLAHRHDAGEGAGDERLVRAVDVGQREILLEHRDAVLAAELDRRSPRVIPPRQ